MRPAIETIAARLAKALAPQTIILFGSYAYGDPDESSDIDLFLVLDTANPSSLRARHVDEVLRDMRIAKEAGVVGLGAAWGSKADAKALRDAGAVEAFEYPSALRVWVLGESDLP